MLGYDMDADEEEDEYSEEANNGEKVGIKPKEEKEKQS